jgi:predicted hydrolase (HD superfamily)
MKSRVEAITLLHEYTPSESLRKHAYAVESALRGYAEYFGEDIELWGMTGLLHDFDYEKYPNPTPDGHPYMGVQILGDLGYPEEMRTAIMGHAKYTGVPRESKLAKTLFACDELCGLVMAATLVRPDKSLHNLEVSSVKKKMKDKAFARGVDREDIIVGAKELEVELEDHIGRVIGSMRGISGVLFA